MPSHLASGAPVPGWPASTGGVPVSSTPSVAVLGGAAPNDTVFSGLTTSSPASANLSGSGKLEVVEGTDNQHGAGTVYALNGPNGAVIWHQAAKGEVIGSVVTANLRAGHQDVIVTSTGGAEVLDGRTGALLTTVGSGVVLESSALVTDDPIGTVGVTLAGFNAYGTG
jgi:hypothetical protein